ncbi:MAG TPA: hypothetical protein PLD25_17105 [Chloroflexota bacterium]|nr:hypothetical protein [Chloroflexota bacterium]HUM69526.1 hypothetical protein [Chloroflexota bacterium]
MCCLVTILVFLGPRFALIAWYLMDPLRFNLAINSFLLSCLGFLFLPWTMLAYLAAWTSDGVMGFGWVIVLFGFLIDISAYSGGGYGNRKQIRRYR